MGWEACRDLAELVASSGTHVKTGSVFCVLGAKYTISPEVGVQKSQRHIILGKDTKSHSPLE